MELTDDELHGSVDHDHLHGKQQQQARSVTKGRRTKRVRSLSCGSGSVKDIQSHQNNCSSSSSASPSLDDHDAMSDVTTEEEDMANCLILLAQGVWENEAKNNTNTNIVATTTSSSNNNNSIIVTSDNNNSNNNNVYECKTCSRVFPSFQALGGHRASHKKPRPGPTVIVRSPTPEELHVDGGDLSVHDQEDHDQATSSKAINFTSININNIINNNKSLVNKNNNAKAKVHECSICGSEFPSGQALGGHMRRHRAPQQPTAVIGSGGGARGVLALDLNLPAPDDDGVVDQDHFKMAEFHALPTPAAY